MRAVIRDNDVIFGGGYHIQKKTLRKLILQAIKARITGKQYESVCTPNDYMEYMEYNVKFNPAADLYRVGCQRCRWAQVKRLAERLGWI